MIQQTQQGIREGTGKERKRFKEEDKVGEGIITSTTNFSLGYWVIKRRLKKNKYKEKYKNQ